MVMNFKIIVVALSSCFAISPCFAEQMLTSNEIKATFSGKTAIGKHHKKGKVKTYHSEDGKIISVSEDGDKRVGEWWAGRKKDRLCIRWRDNPKKRCRIITTDGNGGFKKIHPKKDKVVTKYQQLVAGNLTEQ